MDQEEPTAQTPPKRGAFRVWTSDDNGNFVSTTPKTPGEKPAPDPAAEAAVDIYFAPVGPPTDDQSKLYDDISHVLDVLRRLYLPDGPRANKAKFRACYVRIFRLTQVGLESADPSPKQAKAALESLKASLIEDDGLHIKTRNLGTLGQTALLMAIPFAVAYFVLRVLGEGPLDRLLTALQISRVTMANFMLLWIACFVGVCLSYGVRTATLTLDDLVNPGPDRLPPGMRLLFIGTLTMLFGLMFVKGIVELKIGPFSTAAIATDPMLALIVGAVFGLGEAALPGLAGKRVETLLKGLQ